MAQRLAETQDSLENEELFIAETAKLAELVVEQKESQVTFVNECHVSKGAGASKALGLKENVASEEELQAAKKLGVLLREVSVRYHDVLTDTFDGRTAQTGGTSWDINYDAFSIMCTDVLRRTIDSVGNRWNQAALVFANYVRLKQGLQGDPLRQNEIATYIGRYLCDLGLQSWIQIQGGWGHAGVTTSEPPICPPEGTAV